MLILQIIDYISNQGIAFILKKMFFIRIFRFLLRLFAVLASVVVLVSGYLFFLSLSSRERDEEDIEDKQDQGAEEEEDVISD